MKYLFVLFLGISLSSFAQELNQVTIKGTIKGDNKGSDEIICRADGIPVLRQDMKNGNFEFKIQFEKPFYVSLFSEYDYKVKRDYQSACGLLIDRPGLIEISIENIDSGFKSATVTGLKSAQSYQFFSKGKRNIYDQISELTKKKNENGHVTSIDIELEKRRDSLEEKLLHPFLLEFIGNNKDAYVGIFALFESKDFIELDEIIKNFNEFSTELKNSIHGKYISEYITVL